MDTISQKSRLKASSLVALFSLACLFVLSGCATIARQVEAHPGVSRLSVTIATLKYIGEDSARAERVAAVAQAVGAVATDAVVSTLDELEREARRQIDWQRLDAADTLLVNALIVAIRSELERRLGGADLPPGERPTVALVFQWVEDAAKTAA